MQSAVENPSGVSALIRLPPALPWALDQGELYSRHLAEGESVEIRILSGECWITLEGDPADRVLTFGSALRLPGPGLLLMESLQSHSHGVISRFTTEFAGHE